MEHLTRLPKRGGGRSFDCYRPFSRGVASRLATAIYVAMVTPILYDNSYRLTQISNMKVISLMVDFVKLKY